MLSDVAIVCGWIVFCYTILYGQWDKFGICRQLWEYFLGCSLFDICLVMNISFFWGFYVGKAENNIRSIWVSFLFNIIKYKLVWAKCVRFPLLHSLLFLLPPPQVNLPNLVEFPAWLWTGAGVKPNILPILLFWMLP